MCAFVVLGFQASGRFRGGRVGSAARPPLGDGPMPLWYSW